MKKFLDSTKSSIRNLSKDNYSKIYGINTIDNVLMFVPIEPALLTLYNEANKLIEESWNNKIIIVGPSTLPFLLKAIENIVNKYAVNQIYHLAAILSAKGEKNPLRTWDLNISMMLNVFEVARTSNVKKVFFPTYMYKK